MFKNWFHTTQKLSGATACSKLDIIKRQQEIINCMINEESFKQQLQTARSELNIEGREIESYSSKLDEIDEEKKLVTELLNSEDPDIQVMFEELQKCMQQGLKYPEFLRLFDETRKIFECIASLSYVLDQHNFIDDETAKLMFFTREEYEEIVSYQPGNKKYLK